MTDDPDFYAWLDGELAEPQASAVACRVAADPELAAFAKQHRALASRLTSAFAPLATSPVSERLLDAARSRAEVIDFATASASRRRRSFTGLAIAASLVIGLTIGVALPRGGQGSFVSRDGQLAASGHLAGALDRQLASAGERNGVRIGVSFKDQSGRFCRSFTAETHGGLACRAGDDWAIQGLVAGQQSSGEYRMAVGIDPALGAIIDSRVSGVPLNPTSEAKAVSRGWKD
jgi:hypothetical protein